jgi:hypothetical protein
MSTADTGDALPCYCVCHSPYSSCAWCEHCQGDNEVARYHREREQSGREGGAE